MSNRFVNPVPQFVGDDGLPLTNGTLTFYLTGSSTIASVWQNAALNSAAANPQTLNDDGATPQQIFLDPAITYKAVLADALGVIIWTRDPVVDLAANVTAAFQVYAGNPNGNVAGNAGSVGGVGASVVYDITNQLLYVCTTSGVAAAAAWTSVGTSFPSSITFSGIISPTALAADTNNWAPAGLSTAVVVRASASAAYNLTGISASGVNAGRLLELFNSGTFNITLLGNNASSTGANRFLIPRPLVLRPLQGVWLEYDLTSTGWRTLGNMGHQAIAGGFKNLKVQTTSNTITAVTADALTLEDANGEAYRALTVSLAAIDISTSGANGLDTGAEGSSTWYAVWVIYNPTTNTVAGLLSIQSAFASLTLPSGYTFGARVGWVRNDGSSNLLRTLQYGRVAQYVVGTNPTNMVTLANGVTGTWSATSPTLSAVSVTSVVPTTAMRIMLVASGNWKGGTTANIQVAPNTAWGGANNGPSGSGGNTYPINITTALGSPNNMTFSLSPILLEGTTIGVAMDAAGGAVGCIGWEDNI